ncbi:hypothetical protein PoB_005313700 [Plakobranchus ocellatus]|uniref:Uncharacterized protein n=1 Tax=Plakobranchus ocellatus TaxID=259542 RepID=A0AAV4C5I7_9GAST|nr:hypothetical protein PoB_005313700 [Plakobranchus ocellatus]
MFSGPPSGQGTSGGARTHDSRIPAALMTDSLFTVSPTLLILCESYTRLGQFSSQEWTSAVPFRPVTDRSFPFPSTPSSSSSQRLTRIPTDDPGSFCSNNQVATTTWTSNFEGVPCTARHGYTASKMAAISFEQVPTSTRPWKRKVFTGLLDVEEFSG